MRIATRHDTVMNEVIAGSGEMTHLSNEELRQKNIKLSKLQINLTFSIQTLLHPG